MLFGERIRLLREEKQLLQRQLAATLGIDTPMYSKIERGYRRAKREQDPTLRGYGRSNIYNMVLLYDTYSSLQFVEYQEKLKLNEFVQTETAQLGKNDEFVQTPSGQLENRSAIVQTVSGQLPIFLKLTTLSNHFEIINACQTIEERIFYVLYSYKERLNNRELKRCLKNHTFHSLTGDKHNLSKGLREIYPQAAPMLKDAVFVDFLGLPQKHSRL
jgi:transcriptional regulator with XRE-family HTH domain